ncbi:ABC transporter substrate-binding protein [Kitasatospora sp. NPDC088346]|uniref:ABC transporter substrate-binding protein n=1 Tax=Kitasatospora sp. NPDC088346 TaxID=3364073 RepID=UPI003810068C
MWSVRDKRRLVSAAGAVLALAPTACSAIGGDEPAVNKGSAAHRKVTLITGLKSDPFYVTMTCAAQAEAQLLKMDLTVDGSAQWDVNVQRPLIDSAAASRPDGLLVSPVDQDALTPSLKRLQTAGTKIGLVDTAVGDSAVGITRISSDNETGGVLAALALAKQMGDKGSVLLISVKAGVTTTDARIKGFVEEMARHPGITVLPTLYDDNQPATAAAQVQSALAAHPDLRGVFAGNTITAQGIATGLTQAGKQRTVKVVGFDAGPDQVTALNAGTVQVLVAQDPAGIGTQAVDQLAAAFEGRSVSPEIATTMAAITKEDIGNPDFAKYLYHTEC